jgi:hypothetical protein
LTAAEHVTFFADHGQGEGTPVDEHAIDRLARSLSAAPSRRRLLGSVLGGVAAVLAGASAIQAQGRGHGLALGMGKD